MQWINIILQNSTKKKINIVRIFLAVKNKIIFIIYLQQPQSFGEVFKNYPKEFI